MSYRDVLAMRGYVRHQIEPTVKRPGDLVLTSSRVLKVERREVLRG